MRKKKTTKIFLCHSSEEKPFVRRLANELKSYGVDVWFDEWEMKVGDSLREKIERGISKSSYLGIILSKKSTRSKWVRRELNAAFAKELQSNKIFILPILIEKCNVPLLLRDKKYANFILGFKNGMKDLLEASGIVFNDDEYFLKEYFFRFLNITPFWWGHWRQAYSTKYTNSDLFISNVGKDFFDFEISIFKGSHSGGLTGRAKILDINNAIYEKSIDDILIQIKFNRKQYAIPTIVIDENQGASYYHGLRAHFYGAYIYDGDLLLERNILNDTSLSKIYEIMGEHYWDFRDLFFDLNESKNQDEFQCKVYTGGIPGLYGLYESILMIGKNGELWMAFLNDLGIRYFTTESKYKKILPKTIEEWRKRFQKVKVTYSRPKRKKQIIN